jgi:hypothetical protein
MFSIIRVIPIGIPFSREDFQLLMPINKSRTVVIKRTPTSHILDVEVLTTCSENNDTLSRTANYFGVWVMTENKK